MSQSNPHSKSLPGGSVPARPHTEGGKSSGREYAVLAYLVPVLGGLIGLAADGNNQLTRCHARQSIAAVITLVLSFLVWAVVGYAVALIPFAGPIVSIALFSLVIAMVVFLAANWLVGLVMALRGEERAIPIANRIVIRFFATDPAMKRGA